MQRELSHNQQKKIAVINDFCGFGRCSIAVALPIISAMHIQCCPLPTAVFSNHTGFESFFCKDFTESMRAYEEEWEKLGLRFDGISTGFLGSYRQIDIVKEFLARFKTSRTKVLVDPVMGDDGKLYPTYTAELAGRMHELLQFADLLTPNLTEACILAGEHYHEDVTMAELTRICQRLAEKGPQQIVISGIHLGQELGNFVYRAGQTDMICARRVGGCRSGTGDVFGAILAADLVNGVPLGVSVRKAADFIATCIGKTQMLGIPETDGICFEENLWELGREAAI